MVLSCRYSGADSGYCSCYDVVTVLPPVLWPSSMSLAVLFCIRLTSTAVAILPHDATTTHLFAMTIPSVRPFVYLSVTVVGSTCGSNSGTATYWTALTFPTQVWSGQSWQVNGSNTRFGVGLWVRKFPSENFPEISSNLSGNLLNIFHFIIFNYNYIIF